MVRAVFLILCCVFPTGCEPFEDVREVGDVTAELRERCVRTRQNLGIYLSRGDPVGEFYLNTNDTNQTPVQVLTAGTEITIRRVVYHTSFEYSEVVIIGDVRERSNVIVSRLFTDESMDELRRFVREEKTATQIAELDPSIAEWCK